MWIPYFLYKQTKNTYLINFHEIIILFVILSIMLNYLQFMLDGWFIHKLCRIDKLLFDCHKFCFIKKNTWQYSFHHLTKLDNSKVRIELIKRSMCYLIDYKFYYTNKKLWHYSFYLSYFTFSCLIHKFYRIYEIYIKII